MIAIAGCLVALAAFAVGRLAPPEPPKLEGTWSGKIKVPGGELTLVVHVVKDGQGYKSTCDSPDQMAYGIPVATTALTGDQVRFDVEATKGVFDGKYSADGKKIVGMWKQAGMDFPLTLEKTSRAPTQPKRPQTPKKPYPYREEAVAYENKAAGVKLAGTLTLPKGKGPFPAVLLITGSGAQDRDESLLGHKPFLVLSDYLTRRGIAVLRLDDRGVGGSTGDISKCTEGDFASDVVTGVAFLKTHQEIKPKSIGLLGHSEGGLVAPLAASKSKDVAFVVMLAGPGVRGDELLLAQAAAIGEVSGGTAKAISENAKLQKAIFQVLREEKDNAAAEKRIRELFKKTVEALPAEQRKAAELAPQAVEAQIKMCLTPWFRYVLEYDPRPALRKVKCPVLAVNGAKDLQVPPKQNLPEIEKALKAGGNRDFTIKMLPGLNHLLQKCKTGSPAEYAGIEETIDPTALKVIGDWIVAHTKR